jgi:carbamoyl-phosphate synthase large subunit
VNNIATAQAWWSYWESREEISMTFIVQEYLPGLNLAWQSLWKDGELIVSQARERLEYIYPFLAVSGVTGTPVVARTVNMPEDWKKIAMDTVLSIDPDATGIFCVDLKGDRDSVPNPTEINCGRFFTTSAGFSSLGHKLGIPGANMPLIYTKLGFEEKIGPFPQFDVLPQQWLYIRHIDLGERWIPAEIAEKARAQGKYVPTKEYEV